MKINKWLIYIGVVIGIVGVLLIVLFYENIIIQNIGISLLAGSILSTTTSLTYYIYERKRIISHIVNVLPSIYMNLSVIKELTGKIVSQVGNTHLFGTLNYKHLSSIADMNVILVSGDSDGEFCGILKKDGDEKAVRHYKKYIDDIRNLKYCLGRVEYWALDADTTYYALQNKQISGQIVREDEKALLENKRNLVIIQTAKVHEYEATLLNKLDDVANAFYRKPGIWETYKQEMQKSVENVLIEAKLYS